MFIKRDFAYVACIAALLSGSVRASESELGSSEQVWQLVKQGDEAAQGAVERASLEVLCSHQNDQHGNKLSLLEFITIHRSRLVPAAKSNPWFSLDDDRQFPHLYCEIKHHRTPLTMSTAYSVTPLKGIKNMDRRKGVLNLLDEPIE